MAWSATQIGYLRTLVNDDATSKQARAESPTGTRDGARTVFQLLHYPVVASSVYLTSNTTIRTQTGFTVDLVNGLLTFTSAPAGTESPWYVDYYWYWQTDAQHTSFLDIASYDIGFSPTATIPDGLSNAWYSYGKHHFFKMMAAKYAWRFNAVGGGQGHEVDVVTVNYKNLADEAKKDADEMKLAYYTRHGQRSSPAVSTGSMSIDPWTPIR